MRGTDKVTESWEKKEVKECQISGRYTYRSWRAGYIACVCTENRRES